MDDNQDISDDSTTTGKGVIITLRMTAEQWKRLEQAFAEGALLRT